MKFTVWKIPPLWGSKIKEKSYRCTLNTPNYGLYIRTQQTYIQTYRQTSTYVSSVWTYSTHVTFLYMLHMGMPYTHTHTHIPHIPNFLHWQYDVEKVINIQNRLYMKDMQNYYTVHCTLYTLCRLHTQYHGSSLKIKNSSTQQRECWFKYLLKATVNCTFSFPWLMMLRGKQLKNLMPAQNALLWKQCKLQVHL